MMKYVFFNRVNDISKSFFIFSDQVQHLQFKNTIGSNFITPSGGFADFKNNQMTVFGKSVSLRKETRNKVADIISTVNNFNYVEFKTDFYSIPQFIIFPDYMPLESTVNFLEERLNRKSVSKGTLTQKTVNDDKTVLVDENKDNSLFFNFEECKFSNIS